MRRLLLTGLCTAVLLLLLPSTALAHASFDVRQVPAGSVQDLVLRVPLEREAVNDLVEVLVPGAFTVTSCDAASGWTCDEATTTTGDTVLTLVRGADGAGDAERFSLTVTAPTEEGVYAFPTIQTYDDGVEAAWIGEPGTDQPAPRLQVGNETAPVETNDDATPHTPLASATPTTEPSATGDPSTTPAPTPTATESATPTVDESAGAATDDAGAGGGGPSPGLLVIGGLLTIAVLAGAIARYRSVTD